MPLIDAATDADREPVTGPVMGPPPLPQGAALLRRHGRLRGRGAAPPGRTGAGAGRAGLGRSDYARTLAALEAAGPRARIHCCFHEDLVAPERSAATVAALRRFLGIPRLEPDPHRPVNRGAAPPLDLEARLRAALAPQYDAMRARFGPRPARGVARLTRRSPALSPAA